jgi:hypothetical protein
VAGSRLQTQEIKSKLTFHLNYRELSSQILTAAKRLLLSSFSVLAFAGQCSAVSSGL